MHRVGWFPRRRAGLVGIAVLCLIVGVGGLAAANPPATVNVRAAGAVGDGRTLDTAALQQAINRCAGAGGGTVYFPAGTYLTGTLVLRSHLTLHLEAGATLLGSPELAHYQVQETPVRSYTDTYVRHALLAGDNLERVTLRGSGTIDGNGGAFRWKEYLNRPYVIRIVRCRDVTVEGLTLRASPMWMQHYLACDRVRIHGLRVFNHASYNNDGLDIDGCHDVQVSDCVIDSDDDAIVLKSTLDRACENVTVTNCVLSSHANAFKLGTESNGGFRNITFSNSVILSPRYSKATYGIQRGAGGIALETVDGGHLENVLISNITLRGVGVPLFLRLGNRARPFTAGGPAPPVGTLRNVSIQNVIATGASRIGCSITGLPGHLVENVQLANIQLEFDGGGRREQAGRNVPERPEAYPSVSMFGELPAYGLYVRHATGISLRDVRIRAAQPDARHALVADDVRDLSIDGAMFTTVPDAASVLRFTDVSRATVRHSAVRGSGGEFLRVEGAATRGVLLADNDLADVGRVVDAGADVPAGAVRESGNTGAAGAPR